MVLAVLLLQSGQRVKAPSHDLLQIHDIRERRLHPLRFGPSNEIAVKVTNRGQSLARCTEVRNEEEKETECIYMQSQQQGSRRDNASRNCCAARERNERAERCKADKITVGKGPLDGRKG